MNTHFLKSTLLLLFCSFCFSTITVAHTSSLALGPILKIRVCLEGAIINNNNAKDANNRPLMRDNLRNNPYTGKNYLPSSDPYTFEYGSVNIASMFTKVGPGANAIYQSIPDPIAVFSVSNENAIVDWVFVELRDKKDNTIVVATRSGLLQRDGDVVDLDGVSGLHFDGVADDSYFVAVRHYKHFGVMTKYAQTMTEMTTLVDFTSPDLLTFDFGRSHPNGLNYTGLAQKMEGDLMAMWSGDFDCNGLIKATSPNDDITFLQKEVLMYDGNTDFLANFGQAYGYSTADFNMDGLVKLTNPNDDRTLVQSSVMFYPLNTNLAMNFELFIEQLPK